VSVFFSFLFVGVPFPIQVIQELHPYFFGSNLEGITIEMTKRTLSGGLLPGFENIRGGI